MSEYDCIPSYRKRLVGAFVSLLREETDKKRRQTRSSASYVADNMNEDRAAESNASQFTHKPWTGMHAPQAKDYGNGDANHSGRNNLRSLFKDLENAVKNHKSAAKNGVEIPNVAASSDIAGYLPPHMKEYDEYAYDQRRVINNFMSGISASSIARRFSLKTDDVYELMADFKKNTGRTYSYAWNNRLAAEMNERGAVERIIERYNMRDSNGKRMFSASEIAEEVRKDTGYQVNNSFVYRTAKKLDSQAPYGEAGVYVNSQAPPQDIHCKSPELGRLENFLAQTQKLRYERSMQNLGTC